MVKLRTANLLLFLLVPIFQGCGSSNQNQQAGNNAVVIKEVYQTQRDEGDNVDSPAVWHGPEGQNWLLATAKEGDVIIIYDAEDGSVIQRVGSSGSGAGNFERPNGISVIDDLLLIVERDNRRIQIFSLPEFRSLGSLTHEDLRLPYGIAVHKNQKKGYEVYVTDNFNPALEGYPPQGELDERVHHFRFSINGDSLASQHVRVFGDITGSGVLHKVESIFSDPQHNRLLIADEAFNMRNIKIYDLEGNFTGNVIADTYFESEPEGIALFRCSNGSGYWIATDQHESEDNKFVVFDRETLKHLGTFKGEVTRNTDGIWLTQKSFGDFEHGAFYPVHDDGSITAISWTDIATELSIKVSCTER